MHIVELEFTDDDRRLAARPAHRDRLRDLHAAGRVVLAGPLAGDTGAVLVFALDRTEVDAELAADPYYTTPGVAVASVREWNPVVGP